MDNGYLLTCDPMALPAPGAAMGAGVAKVMRPIVAPLGAGESPDWEVATEMGGGTSARTTLFPREPVPQRRGIFGGEVVRCAQWPPQPMSWFVRGGLGGPDPQLHVLSQGGAYTCLLAVRADSTDSLVEWAHQPEG